MSTKPKRKARKRIAKKPKRKAPRKLPSKEAAKKVSITTPPPSAVPAPPTVPEKVLALIVRLQGPVAVPRPVESTLRSLGLLRRFGAVLREKNPSLQGMLRAAKDYVTWGEVKTDDIAALLRERGRTQGDVRLTDKFVGEHFGEQSIDALASALIRGKLELKALWQRGIKPVFRLHPPSGGFDHSIKRPFGSRGELGYRGSAISDLVMRMI